MPESADPTEDVAADALTLLSICVLLWLVSLRLGKTWPVDFIWSGWPLLQCALIIARDPHGGLFARRALTCTLVALWGGRLTYNFVSRGGIGLNQKKLFHIILDESRFLLFLCIPVSTF